MYCEQCGAKLPDFARRCPNCGNDVYGNGYQSIDEEYNDYQVDTFDETGKKKTKMKKNTKVLIIAFSILFVAIFTLIAVLYMFRGRRIDRTLQQYTEGYDTEDLDKRLGAMFPKEEAEHVRFLLDKKNEKTVEFFAIVDANPVTSTSVIKKQDLDDSLEKSFNDIMGQVCEVSLDYSEMELLTLQGKDSEFEVIAYKVKKSWYVVPGVLEYMTELQKKADLEAGRTIGETLSACVSNSAWAEDMKPYFGIPISVDTDIQYLPQSVQDMIASSGGLTQKIQFTLDGATGYGFIASESSVEVYISSETSIDEWKVYPDVDASYETGEKKKAAAVSDLGAEYSYVRMLSADSPLLGAWQASNAGLYIGYSVTGGNEGFTPYLYVNDTNLGGFYILHRYDHFSCTGDKGKLIYTGTSYDGEEIVFEFSVQDNSKMQLRLNGLVYDFTRGGLSKEAMKDFSGTWVSGGSVFSEGEYGTEMEMLQDTATGFVYKKDDNYMNPMAETVVRLYDGVNSIIYVEPDQGLYYSDEDRIGYEMEEYTLEGNKDTLSVEIARCGGGGGMGYTYFRDGSDEAMMAAALDGYNSYINNNCSSFNGCRLVYLDNDAIPECIIQDGTAATVLGYSGGEVKSQESLSGTCGVKYRERVGEFCMSGLAGSHSYIGFYVYENGSFREDGMAMVQHPMTEEETDVFTTGDGNEVSEAQYNDYINSYGTYDHDQNCDYSNIFEAYQALDK